MFEVLLIVGVWVALSLAVGATFAIKVIGGPKFAPAAEVLAVQGVAAGATFVSAVWGFAMLSLHLHRLILMFNLSMLVLVAAPSPRSCRSTARRARRSASPPPRSSGRSARACCWYGADPT